MHGYEDIERRLRKEAPHLFFAFNGGRYDLKRRIIYDGTVLPTVLPGIRGSKALDERIALVTDIGFRSYSDHDLGLEAEKDATLELYLAHRPVPDVGRPDLGEACARFFYRPTIRFIIAGANAPKEFFEELHRVQTTLNAQLHDAPPAHF